MGLRVPGPDPSDDLHAESRGSSKRFLGWVTEIDWGARLAAGLNPVSAVMAATKALPGILRFATDAEAVGGTFDGAALTPKQALALARALPLHYSSPASLFTTSQPEGTLAAVDRYAYSSGILHRQSVWQSNAGSWVPVGGMIFVEASDAPGALSALNSVIADLTANNGKGFAPPGVIGQNVITTDRWRWDGSAWLLLNQQPLVATNTSSFSVGGGFTRIPFAQPTGRASDWNSSAQGYSAPRAGLYEASVQVRTSDGTTTGQNVGLAAINAQTEGNDTRSQWNCIPALGGGASVNRYTQQVTRIIQASKGDPIVGTMYVDGSNGASIGAGSAYLHVIPLGG